MTACFGSGCPDSGPSGVRHWSSSSRNRDPLAPAGMSPILEMDVSASSVRAVENRTGNLELDPTHVK